MTNSKTRIVLCALAVTVTAAVLVLTLYRLLDVPAQAPKILLLPGEIQPVTTDFLPVTQVMGSIAGVNARVQLSGTSSTLVYPAAMVPAGKYPAVSLLLDQVNASDVCNDRLAKDVASMSSQTWTLATADVQTSTTDSILHLGVGRGMREAGTYKSPFLEALRGAGYSAWTVAEHLKQVTIFPGVLSVPCTVWSWTPLVTLAGYDDLYVIELDATATNPWKYAVLDIGFWLSNMPGSDPCTRSIGLRTKSGQSILLTPSTYVDFVDERGPKVPLSTEVCVLGISCLAWDSACAFDLANNRFGLSTLYLGNVRASDSAYNFST